MSSSTHTTMDKDIKKQEAATKTMKNLQEGKLPKNEQLVKGIDTFNTKIEDTKPKLSVTGQKATEQFGNILETAKEMIETKNESEHFQKAVYHMYNAGKDQPISARFGQLKDLIFVPNEDIKGIQAQAKQHVDSIVTIVKLCIMSPEFRETLNEFFQFFSSLAHKHSKKLEEKYNRQGHGSDHAFGAVEKSSIISNQDAIKSQLEHKLTHDDWLEPHQHYQWNEKEGRYSLQSGASDISEQSESQEQEEKLINLITDLLQRIHSYPEFSNSVDYLSDSLENLQANWREGFSKIEQAVDVPASASAKSHRQASKREIIEFIENWIGEDYSLDPLIRSILTIKDIVQRDPELKRLFHDLRTFFTKSARDANYVNNKERVKEDARDLVHRARSQLRNKHREEFQRLKRELLFINDAIQHDDSMLTLRDEVKDLVRTLTTDANGNVTIKPELLSDAQLLVQALFDTIKYLPLPPIEREDEKGTFRMENIVVNVTDILPSQIHLSTKLDATGQNNNSIEIRLRHIRAHLRNVKFYVDKRSGFPHIKESGLADIDLAGKHGMDLFISVRPQLPSADSKHNTMFHVNECTCSISKLRLRLRDTKHDFIYKLLSPVINTIARRRIETMVQENIEKAINQLDRAVTKAREQSATAVTKAKEKADRMDVDMKHGKAHTKGKDTHTTHGKDIHKKDTHATHGKEHGKETHAYGKATHGKDTHQKEHTSHQNHPPGTHY